MNRAMDRGATTRALLLTRRVGADVNTCRVKLMMLGMTDDPMNCSRRRDEKVGR